jgi:hypothetical protein
MKKSIIFLNISLLFAWDMQGFSAPTTPPQVKTWCYQNKTWKNNFNYGKYAQISKIDGGEACWVYNKTAPVAEKKDSYQWKEGWNFVTPIFQNWNLDDKFRGNALIAWKYDGDKWKIYNHNVNGIDNFNTLNTGEGMFVYIPKINAKINNQPLFCKDGNCSNIITADKNYRFYVKAPQNKDIKFAIDLYRYSNNIHYQFALGPFKITNYKINTKIPVCVEKLGVGGSCGTIDNTKETFLTYNNGYLSINAKKIAEHFKKSIPDTKEKFLVKFYIEGFDLNGFTPENFGTLGMEGFGTWVSLKNSKKAQFQMELK